MIEGNNNQIVIQIVQFLLDQHLFKFSKLFSDYGSIDLMNEINGKRPFVLFLITFKKKGKRAIFPFFFN